METEFLDVEMGDGEGLPDLRQRLAACLGADQMAALDAPEEMRDVVLVRVDAPPGTLTRGQTGTASMVTDRREDVIVLPSDAVQTYVNRRFVFVLEDELRVERSVEVGLSTSTQVEIVDGLSVGETVVLR